MKQTDFALSLQKFFREHLVYQRKSSDNTIKSYRDTFKIFLNYMSDKRRISASKMTLACFTADEIRKFRKYLGTARKNSEKTQNQRMAALHSFVSFLQQERPDQIAQWQAILAMPSQRCPSKPVKYLSQKEIAALISVIQTNTKKGIRDKAMILLLYDTGARVQEIADLTVQDVRFDTPAQITLTGKGRKMRIVPMMPTTVKILKDYMKVFGMTRDGKENQPLFHNRLGEKLTRFGIAYILSTYGVQARKCEKTIPKKLTPHLLRHSKAMHLLEEGCSEVVIQHILGHSDLKTTSVYAKANVEMTRAALDKINKKNTGTATNEVFLWKNDNDLLSWLENL